MQGEYLSRLIEEGSGAVSQPGTTMMNNGTIPKRLGGTEECLGRGLVMLDL